MPHTQPPKPNKNSVGNITHSTGVAIGDNAKATVVQIQGEPTARKRFNKFWLIIGFVLTPLAFIISLWLFPAEWGQSWRTIFALAMAAIVGVPTFLAAVRQAFEG